MGAEGGWLKRPTKHPLDERCPTWSSDGKGIASTSGIEGNDDIYVISAEGKELTNLTENPAEDAFSP